MTEDAAPVRRRAGVLAALVIFALYGGLAATVDFPSAAVGIQSDEATYYLMGYSLAEDGDLEYRREDIERGFREFPSGPAGIFLKRGVDVQAVGLSGRPPFIEVRGAPDPDRTRLYFGKSFAYPLVAAPFVRLMGTNGFLLLNALLLTAAFLLAYFFISARSGVAIGLLLASAFVFASVVPVYFVWIMPELFNCVLGMAAYFLWLYKRVSPQPSAALTRWLRKPSTDVLAAAVIGLATFSKVTNVLLLAPMMLWLAWQRDWRRLIWVSAIWVVVTAAFFGANVRSSGDWNYQGGDRATCYGTFPFQEEGRGLDVCADRGRDEGLANVIFDPEVFWTNLRANSVYFFLGRNSGLVPYFFPAVFALLAFLLARGGRAPWQWLVLGGVALQIVTFVVSLPYTYFGSGGSVGNRYFMGVYGVCVFLLPAVHSVVWASVPWLVGGLFVAKLVLNPFATSIHPAEHAKSGLFRLLPVELTNTNDLPINTDASRVRIWYGETPQGNPGFQIYYLDDNAYLAEADKRSFWIRGESRAEFLVKTDHPYSRMQVTVSAGPVASHATIQVGGRRVEMSLAAGQSSISQVDLGPGFPYKGNRQTPAYVWVMSVSSSTGFLPRLFEPGSLDQRYLGVRVEPLIVK